MHHVLLHAIYQDVPLKCLHTQAHAALRTELSKKLSVTWMWRYRLKESSRHWRTPLEECKQVCSLLNGDSHNIWRNPSVFEQSFNINFGRVLQTLEESFGVV